MSRTKCLWCGVLFDTIMASCGTGSTWSLFKCPHCKKLMADGNIIPNVVKNDPEIRIEEKYSMPYTCICGERITSGVICERGEKELNQRKMKDKKENKT